MHNLTLAQRRFIDVSKVVTLTPHVKFREVPEMKKRTVTLINYTNNQLDATITVY